MNLAVSTPGFQPRLDAATYLTRAARRGPLTATRARQIIEAVALAQLSRDLAAMLREYDQLDGPAPRLPHSPPTAGRAPLCREVETRDAGRSVEKPRHGSCGGGSSGQ